MSTQKVNVPEEKEEDLVLSLILQEKKVKIKTKDGMKTYTIRELEGEQRNAWMSMSANRGELNTATQTMKVNNFKDFGGDLLAMCLYDDKDQLVSINDIRKFPTTTQEKLFDMAQTLSGLNKKGQEAAKKP